MKIEWNPAWNMGVAHIDEQHQEWFRQVDGLLTALNQNEPFNIELLMAYFKDYSAQHFATEETLMHKHDYHRTGQHTLAHRGLQERLELIQGIRDVTPELLYLLAEWLIIHIAKEDFALAVFLRDKLEP